MYKGNNLLPEIDLGQGNEIGRGATSTVYRLPDGTVCKLFNPEFSEEEILRESRMAESAYALGIRVPRPYGLVKAEEKTGIRSEFLEGETLADVLKNDEEQMERILPDYIRELKRFHETRADAGDFVCAKSLYLEKIEKLRGSSWYTAEELEKMRQLVLSVPDRCTLVYGDYHPQNILMKDGELFFVDLGDMCLGHPVFDFAMIANTHYIIPKMNPAYAEKFFGVPPKVMLTLWDDLFTRYFSDFSSEKKDEIKMEIMAFAVLRQGLSPADGRVFSKQVLEGNVAATRMRLLPGIERITGSIDW